MREEETEVFMDPAYQSISNTILTAEQAWRAADHILSVTFPVVQDPKLLLRALEHLDKACRGTITAVLKREYLYKGVQLGSDGERNKEAFFSTCSVSYGVSEADSTLLREVLDFGSRHRNSSVEFSQQGKTVLLDDQLGSVIVDCQRLQQLAQAVRRLQLRLQEKFRNKTE